MEMKHKQNNQENYKGEEVELIEYGPLNPDWYLLNLNNLAKFFYKTYFLSYV